MSEQTCYRNHCQNKPEARITLIGGKVLDTMTVDLCLTHYYEAVQAVVGQPITAGAIPHEDARNPVGVEAHGQPRGEQ